MIDFVGSWVQTLSADDDFGQLPNVEIDKSGGSLTVGTAHPLSIGGNWDDDHGTFNAACSTVQSTGGGTAKIDTGSSSFATSSSTAPATSTRSTPTPAPPA